MTFLKIEKKIACFDLPKPTAIDCPDIWKAIIKNPKKYKRSATTPGWIISWWFENIWMNWWGNNVIISQIKLINETAAIVVNLIPSSTLPYSFAP